MERRTAAGLVVAAMMLTVAGGQSILMCSLGMIASFTPCVSYVTGSTNSSEVPTSLCCTAVGGLLETSTACACQLLSGSIPFGLPFNPARSYNLTKYCNTTTVDLFNCKALPTVLPPIAPAQAPPPTSPPPPPPPPTLPPFTISGSTVSASITIYVALLTIASMLLIAVL